MIGRLCRDVPLQRAMEVVLGYTAANDVTARDLQRSDGQWTRAKGFDSFCPLGPWIVTDLDMSDLDVTCTVNGEVRQHGQHGGPPARRARAHLLRLRGDDAAARRRHPHRHARRASARSRSATRCR